MYERLWWRLITPLFLIAFGMPTPLHAAEANEARVTFQIVDDLAEDQIDEEILVSINRLPVGILKIDAAHPHANLTVTVPAAPSYHYDLCGHLNQHEADGKPGVHNIDNGGSLNDLDGRFLVAMNNGATIFGLVDQSPHKPQVRTYGLGSKHSCSDTVAMLVP